MRRWAAGCLAIAVIWSQRSGVVLWMTRAQAVDQGLTDLGKLLQLLGQTTRAPTSGDNLMQYFICRVGKFAGHKVNYSLSLFHLSFEL